MKYDYKPSLKELRTSLKYRSKEYLLHTSLHGFPYFMDHTRPKWERIVWFLLTVGSIIAIIATILIIFDKFQTDPTITGIDVMTDQVDIEFPRIFICFDWIKLNHSILRANEMHLHEQVYNWIWGKDIHPNTLQTIHGKKNNFRDTFKMMMPDCNHLISNCAYKNKEVPCNQLFVNVLITVGACCKLKPVESLQIMDLSWNLDFEISNSSFPWRLYLTQHVDPSPLPDEREIIKIYFPANIEFIAEITYTTPDIRYLTLGQRKCYYSHEAVSSIDCEINCFIDTMLKRCNCVPWFLSSADNIECPLSKYSCLNRTKIDMNRCGCALSCDYTSYSVQRVTQSIDKISRMMLRKWPTAFYKKEMRFGYLDLLVSFGGIAGLFLGYSLLITVEFGYYFSLRTYCGAVIQSSQQKCNISRIYVAQKPAQKVDVNPKYYQYID